jgi:hypothetical protein
MAFLQKSYIIAGKPAIEAQLAIAMVNSSGLLRGSIRYKHDGKGKDRACTAYCVENATGEVLQHTLHWHTVEAEGWTSKKGSKWITDPLLMLEYRSAMRLIRTHFPEVLLGMLTKEEADEVNTLDAGFSPQATQRTSLAERLQTHLAAPDDTPAVDESKPAMEFTMQPDDAPTPEELFALQADEEAHAMNREDN